MVGGERLVAFKLQDTAHIGFWKAWERPESWTDPFDLDMVDVENA